MSEYERKDKFYQMAKSEGYVARSAYKLLELDKKFGILKPNSRLVDLGCAPGGWLQVAQEKLKGTGTLVGIDLLPLHFTPGPGVHFIQGDFLDPKNQEQIRKLLPQGAAWVISDMSPNISGIKFRDLAASAELCEMALNFARDVLKPGGGLIVKIFPGPEQGLLKKKLKESFTRIVDVLPEATRKTSSEIYVVATGYKK